MSDIDWKNVKVERYRRRRTRVEEATLDAIAMMGLMIATGLVTWGFFKVGHFSGLW